MVRLIIGTIRISIHSLIRLDWIKPPWGRLIKPTHQLGLGLGVWIWFRVRVRIRVRIKIRVRDRDRDRVRD